MSHTDGQFRATAFISIAVVIICMILAYTLPESMGGKNSVPEYLQLLLLFIGTIMAFRANNHQTLFRFAGFVLIFLLLREINYGRTLPCFADPNDPNKFKKWKEIPYGWLAHVLVGIYLAVLLLYFLCKKLWRDVWELLTQRRIPLWETSVMVVTAVCAQLTERIVHNDFLEEFFELSFYTAFMCLLWRYTRGALKSV